MNITTGLLIGSLVAATGLNAGTDKLAKDLRSMDRNASVDVIVQYRNAATTEHHTKMARKGAKLRRELSLVNAAVYKVSVSSLEDLSNDPEIEFISPDRVVK